jgi:hypothetical protein
VDYYMGNKSRYDSIDHYNIHNFMVNFTQYNYYVDYYMGNESYN